MKTCDYCKCKTEKINNDRLCSNCSTQFMFQEIEKITEMLKNMYEEENNYAERN